MIKGELLPIENGVEWKINNFFSVTENHRSQENYQDSYNSPSFSYDGTSWNFCIYPNGDGPSAVGYVDLYLCRKSYYPPIVANVILSIKNTSGGREINSNITVVFDCYKHRRKFSCLISRSDLIRRKTQLVPSDILTIVCTFSFPKSTAIISDITTKDCCYCKEIFSSESISLHEKRCLRKPVKCPYCSEAFLLEDWFNHECQKDKAEGECNASGLSSDHNKIHQDLKQLLQDKKLCDVILKVKEQEFPAHKAILAARSPVLASTFGNDMKEKESNVVNIEDCDPSIFPDFLCFLYTDDVENLSKENVFELFTVADKYDVPDLRQKCLKFMNKNLSVDVFCKTITLAMLHSQTELINFATDFFVKNAPKIIMTTQWQSFVSENPIESNELFIKFATSNKNSNV